MSETIPQPDRGGPIRAYAAILTLTALANQFGTAHITISVSDGQLTTDQTFLFTVTSVDDATTISDIGNQSTAANTATANIPFIRQT